MQLRVTGDGAEGWSYKQTRALWLRTPTRGVRTDEPRTWWSDVEAFALVLGAGAAFSHVTAAGIQRLPVAQTLPLHVTAPKRGSRRGIVWHQRDTGPVQLWRGLPVTAPLRTWQDLAGLLALPALVAVADVLLSRRLCSPAELHELGGVWHAAVLTRAAELADPGSKSPRESMLRVAMHEGGLPPPELNVAIIEQGEWLGEGDFVWREYRLIADYDGGHHDAGRQRHQDAQTRDDYAAAGWRHVALTKRMSVTEMLNRVERALRERGWAP